MTRPRPDRRPAAVARKFIQTLDEWDNVTDDGFIADSVTEADLVRLIRQVRAECAAIAETPYSDAVSAFGSDEPAAVGKKIATAIRNLTRRPR